MQKKNSNSSLQYVCGSPRQRAGRLHVLEPRGRRKLGDSHPSTLSIIYGLADLLERMERFDEAEELFREELEGCNWARKQSRAGPWFSYEQYVWKAMGRVCLRDETAYINLEEPVIGIVPAGVGMITFKTLRGLWARHKLRLRRASISHPKTPKEA